VIVPLHFFAMFCLFYDLYFVSKSLVTAETRRPVTFYDYAGPFFLIWFFPMERSMQPSNAFDSTARTRGLHVPRQILARMVLHRPFEPARLTRTLPEF